MLRLLRRVLLSALLLIDVNKQYGVVLVVGLAPLFRNPSRAILPPAWPTTTSQILSPRRGRRSKTGSLELGIQTVQLLTNKKKQEKFRRDFIQQYPLVPHFLIDGAIHTVAAGFAHMAPETLQEALQPGGMAKFRPAVRKAVVEFAIEQKAVRDVPLVDTKDKKLWVGSLVDMALDQLFQDADWVLSSPEVRLEALEQEIRTIKEMEMTRRRIVMFNLRRHPWRFIIPAGVVALATVYYLNIFPWLGVAVATLQKASLVVWTGLAGVAGTITKCGGWCMAAVSGAATKAWSITSPVFSSAAKLTISGLQTCTAWVASLGKHTIWTLQWCFSTLLALFKVLNPF